MITAHANSGIDALHAALTSADTQLERISTRLQSELSLHHPSTKTNPFTLFQRLSSLKTELPALHAQLISIYNQKAHLVAQCSTHLSETTRLAKSVLSVAVLSGSDPSSVYNELALTENCLNVLLADFRKANADFIQCTDLKGQELNLALLRAVADIDLETEAAAQESVLKENVNEPEEVMVEKIPLKSSLKAKGNVRKTASGSKKTVTVKDVEKPKAFIPVSKVVYNRLPRNLKIKAGKLPQVNEFYEKVFNALCDASAPLRDAQLRSLTGEHDMIKFEVLRGLAVLRHSKQGWMLAG